MKETFDVELDLSINKFRLDEECLSHPSVYYKYAKAQADAERLLNETKNNLKVVFAEAQVRQRKLLADSGAKVTEASVAAAVDLDAEYRNAQKELLEMQDSYTQLTAIVKAMEARRSSLDNLVKLFQTGYFSSAVESGTASQKRTEDAVEEARQLLLRGKTNPNE